MPDDRDSRRVDGRPKVTGAAVYSSDVGSPEDLHAVPLLDFSGPGRVTSIDAREALDDPGVHKVMTSADFLGDVGPGTFLYDGGHFHTSFAPLASDEVRYSGQLVGLVVASTPEAARVGAARIRIRTEVQPAHATFEQPTANDIEVFTQTTGLPSPAHVSGTQATVVERYATAPAFHQALEPYSMRAEWQGEKLTVRNGSQWVSGEAQGLAEALRIPPANVRVVGQSVGGAFGSRVLLMWHVVYTAAAARRLGRPVRLHVDRAVMATLGSFRPGTTHEVSMSLDDTGRIIHHRHHVRIQTSASDLVPLRGLEYASQLYETESTDFRESLVRSDLPTPGFMRAPGEYPVAFAVESALDEVAIRTGRDPVALRLDNLAATDVDRDGGPVHLEECLRRGAEVFGWSARRPEPASMFDNETGETLGWGVASAHYPAYGGGLSCCRITRDAHGAFKVMLAAHDPGTGLASAVAVAVARILETPLGNVEVVLGDSDLPSAPMAAGSASTRTAVAAAADAAARLRRLRRSSSSSQPLEALGQHVPAGMSPIQRAAAKAGKFAQVGSGLPGHESMLRLSVGAHFVEVGVDPHAGRIRVRRMVGVFDVGQVLHPRALHGQLEGGMIWGAGHALMEDAALDPATGRFLAAGLADYHVMTHADVPQIDIEVLGETDPETASGAKGAGELGVVGSSAAVANALRHATGVRVRSLPIRPAQVFADLADMQPVKDVSSTAR